MDDAPIEIASTLQSASIQPHPDVNYDLSPSTAASRKEPVTLAASATASDIAEDEIPLSAVRSRPRRNTMPPLPDLRFEQSYLKSIEAAAGWQGVLYITVRDQVFLPLVQGALWTLLISGWRAWNREAKFSGQTAGARIRRWWWGVNNWRVPEVDGRVRDEGLAGQAREVSFSFSRV